MMKSHGLPVPLAITFLCFLTQPLTFRVDIIPADEEFAAPLLFWLLTMRVGWTRGAAATAAVSLCHRVSLTSQGKA